MDLSNNAGDKNNENILSGTSNAAPGESGKNLWERINRLPQRSSTPYSALSILKAHCSFQSGICLNLKNDSYQSYTSVGFGLEKIIIRKETIWSEENSGRSYFMLDSSSLAEENPVFKITRKNYTYWLFPLDPSVSDTPNTLNQAWDTVLILGVLNSPDGNSSFNPEPVSVLLSHITNKIRLTVYREPIPEAPQESIQENLQESQEVPQESQQNKIESSQENFQEILEESQQSTTESPQEIPQEIPQENPKEINALENPQEIQTETKSWLEEQIGQYQTNNSDFNCILLDIPESGEENREEFCKKVSSMIHELGMVIPLPSGRPLILFPMEKDRELIAHRITRNLNTRALLSFQAHDPGEIQNQINSLSLND